MRRHRYDYDDENDFPDFTTPSGHSPFFFGFVTGICAALILVMGGVLGAVSVFCWAAYS